MSCDITQHHLQIAAAVASQSEHQMLYDSSPLTPDLELHSVTNTLSALGQYFFFFGGGGVAHGM